MRPKYTVKVGFENIKMIVDTMARGHVDTLSGYYHCDAYISLHSYHACWNVSNCRFLHYNVVNIRNT